MTTVIDSPDGLVALVGSSLGATPWQTISQDDVNTFGAVTRDEQWIHVDAERAQTGPFGGTIVHGYLTLSLVGPLFAELLRVREVSMVVNYGLEKVRFPAPVPVGKQVRLTASVAEVTEIKGAIQLVADAVIEVEGSTKPGCAARAVYRFFP